MFLIRVYENKTNIGIERTAMYQNICIVKVDGALSLNIDNLVKKKKEQYCELSWISELLERHELFFRLQR